MAIRDSHEIKNFIKGKITEIIFEELFREGSNFEVIPFGYEKNFPEIAQYQEYFVVKDVLKVIKRMPDFLLVSSDKTEVFLVEVKYCTHPHPDQLEKMALDTLKYWDPSWLFVATPDDFYFAPCHEIKNQKGKIRKLTKSWIYSDAIYNKFLNLLREFENK